MCNMNTKFFEAKSTIKIPNISLKSVWMVNADSTYDVRKNGGFPSNEWIVIITTKGIGKILLKTNKSFYVKKANLFLINHNDINRYFCTNSIWSFYWFAFTIDNINEIKIPVNKLINIGPLKYENDQVLSCLESLQSDNPITKKTAPIKFLNILYEWIQSNENNMQPTKPYQKQIKAIAQYMRNNLDKRITIELLSKKAGLCERRFRQLFINIYGITPKKYFDRLRMDTAEGLLENTNLSINAISEKLGYSSQFHFTREFKKHYNISPINYRRK